MADFYDNEDSGNSDDTGMDMEAESDVPEEKLGLVPLTFFKNEVEPGDREEIEVVRIADGEAVIKCVYGKDDDEDREDGDMEEEPVVSDASTPSEAEADELMA